MQAIGEALAGFQLTLLPEVEAYWLRNERHTPEQPLRFKVGDRVRHANGDRFFYRSRPYEEAAVVAVAPGVGYGLAFGGTCADVWYPDDLLELATPVEEALNPAFKPGDRVELSGPLACGCRDEGKRGTVTRIAGKGTGYAVRLDGEEKERLMCPGELVAIGEQTSSASAGGDRPIESLKPAQSKGSENELSGSGKSKRVQVGWIEERTANPRRDNPTTCYYFGWYEMQEGTRRKLKTYIPQNQMSEIWRMVKIEKRPYTETLQVIRKSGKLHHANAPKL